MNTIEAYAFNDKSLMDVWSWVDIANQVDDILRNDSTFMEYNWEMMDEYLSAYGAWLKDPTSHLPHYIYEEARDWAIDQADIKLCLDYERDVDYSEADYNCA